jgi:hypothetical protein
MLREPGSYIEWPNAIFKKDFQRRFINPSRR